jgi:hypothetical protein
MSQNHQVTVPLAIAAASSIDPGDRFRVESNGIGRFVMTRIEEYRGQHLSQLARPEDSDEEPAGPNAAPPGARRLVFSPEAGTASAVKAAGVRPGRPKRFASTY